jgi:hypothetical protein
MLTSNGLADEWRLRLDTLVLDGEGRLNAAALERLVCVAGSDRVLAPCFNGFKCFHAPVGKTR